MQAEESKEEKIRKLRIQLDKLNRSTIKTRPQGDTLSRDLRRASKPQTPPPVPQSPPQSIGPALKPIVYQRNIPRQTRIHTDEQTPAYTLPTPLESSVTGREVIHPIRGTAFLIETLVADIDETPDAEELFEKQMQAPEQTLLNRLQQTHPLAAYQPGDFIFADIETTGLNSSPLFLIGVMVHDQKGLTVRQYLARDYAEEAAVIAFFFDECINRKIIVTFNGKSFDYPYIRTRAAATGIPLPPLLPHFDLLHECRRIWKHTLPDCKLQTLERYVCNRMRHGDIPGHMIPQAYHDYVRSGNAWQIAEVLKHNMIDIVTLGELMGRWPEK